MKTKLTFAVIFSIVSALISPAVAFYPKADPPGGSSTIIGIQKIDGRSGIAFTSDTIYLSDDDGASWRELAPAGSNERISAVYFGSRSDGFVVVADAANGRAELAATSDGGASWKRSTITNPSDDTSAIDLDTASVAVDSTALTVTFRIVTSSNFRGIISYRSIDGGITWSGGDQSVDLNFAASDLSAIHSGDWSIVTDGKCAGFKVGCVQETKILAGGGRDITPTSVRELTRSQFEAAHAAALNGPGGATRTSLNRGFDQCLAGSVAQMRIWWDNSPLFDSNIYMSGRNRACKTQPFTNNPAWIDQVSAMGWGLIPTIVGYQSPCTASATTVKLSYDPVTAETQGRGEADIAVADAVSIGLGTGTVLYYDMERYDPPSPDTLGCRTATVAFLKGWTERLRELGYKSGTYGSPKNAQEDWAGMAPASRMDAIWMARWDNVPSVWTYVTFPTFPTNVWNNHQRIKQWQVPHNETWGGVTFNIDGNISDGPVAGVPVPRNRNADFDGDGMSDISVFRPDTGVWYRINSGAGTFSFQAFGAAGDIPVPGDYDVDGKTDHAVFRPSNSTWYMLTKGAFTSRIFGESGDIPAAADYNGDGKTDIAIFRPSSGTWYFLYSDSQGTFTSVTFGVNGDRPAAADYDGDGKADVAVYRPSDGTWYILGTTAGYYSVTWGFASDVPVQADYDGDGKADPAVYRDGTWYLFQSTEGFRSVEFGVPGDVPTPGYFDNDARGDIAVFRPSTGTWYFLNSVTGFISRDFGVAGDQPLPAAYLPK